jgi:hypothetical protein
MATFRVTNISGGELLLPELFVTLADQAYITVEYESDHIPKWPGVLALYDQGQVTISVLDTSLWEDPAYSVSDPQGYQLNYYSDPIEFNCGGWQPDRFYESQEDEVFALAEAEGVSVVKVNADHGDDVQAAIDAAQAAGPYTIVWFDVAYDAEEAVQLLVADGNPIQIIGFSRNPEDTKLKRAAAGTIASILRINAGPTMCAILAAADTKLRRKRLLIRDICFDVQDGVAAASQCVHVVNSGAIPLEHYTVENCIARNSHGSYSSYGFNIEGLSTGGAMKDVVYDNVTLFNCSTGIKHDQGELNGLHIVNCKAIKCAVSGMYIRNNDQKNLRVENCIYAYCGEYGLLIEHINDAAGGVHSSHILDSIFYSNGWQFNPLVANPAGLILYCETGDGCSGLAIKRCKFYQNGVWQPFVNANGRDHGSGIKFKLKSALASGVEISDCDFQDNGHFGVHLHARSGYDAEFNNIVVTKCNFKRHILAGVGADDLSGYADSQGRQCAIRAIGNWWDSPDGAADDPLDTGYTSAMYTGAGHAAAAGADACLSSTPFGYKRETNEAETRYPVTITVVN